MVTLGLMTNSQVSELFHTFPNRPGLISMSDPKASRKATTEKDERRSTVRSTANKSTHKDTPRGLNFRFWLYLTFWTVLVLGAASTFYFLRRSDYIRRLELQCLVARELGKWDELEGLAVEWGIAEPLNPIPFEHAAVAAFRRGGTDRAYAYLAEMPDHGTLEAWLLKGEIELKLLNDPLASIDSCERAILLSPSNTEAHHRLLYFWSMSRQTNRLKQEVERGIEHGAATLETYAYWFALDHLWYSDAAQVNRTWAENYPGNEHFHVAAILALALMPEFTELQRENDLRLLEERFPNNAEVLFTQIERAIDRGDDIRVESLLESKRSHLENDYRYWRSRGWLQTERGRFEDARNAFDMAQKLAPLDWQTLNERAAMIRKEGTSLEQADEIAKRAQSGRGLFEQIKRSESIFSLPDSFYIELAHYFEVCGLPEPAGRIRASVEDRGR